MTLYFHLAAADKEAPRKRYTSSFSEIPHDLIYYQIGLPRNGFPLIRKMQNEHIETVYKKVEVELLEKEIKELEQLYDNKQILEELSNIKLVCREAINQGSKLWVKIH